MFRSMKVLISKKFYRTAEEARGKIDVFFAVGRLNEQEYRELNGMIPEVYA